MSALPPIPPEQRARMDRAKAVLVEWARGLHYVAIHGDDADGNMDVEFSNSIHAFRFMREHRMFAATDIRPGDSITSFTQRVVVQFNMMDYAKRMNIS